MKNNILQEHIHTDYLSRGQIQEYFLNEEHGYVPKLDEYLNSFKKALPEKFISGKIFSITDKAFMNIPDRFFKNITIQIGVKFVVDAKEYPRGAYISDKVFYSKATDKICNPIITLMLVTGEGSRIQDQLTGAFAHELLHCYEDYQRTRKGADSLSSIYDKQKYKESIMYGDKAKFSEKVLKSILYFLNKQEQHAYIGELKALFNNATVEELKSSEKAIEFLQNTLFYKNYTIVQKYIDKFRTEDFKPNTKINMVYKFLEIYPDCTKKIKNFHDLAKSLVCRWEKWDRKFKSNLGKIIFDIYYEKNNSKSYINLKLDDVLENSWVNVNDFDNY